MKTKGHSIWMMPRGDVYEKLAGIIRRLSAEYNTPLFEPHVTLLGEVMQSAEDVLRRAEELASEQHTCPIVLKTIDCQKAYFRRLFVGAERTFALQALHERAKDLFDIKESPEYMPHLSLMYGNVPDDINDRMIKTIGSEQSTEFIIDSIYVVKTDGEVNAWCRVKEISFS